MTIFLIYFIFFLILFYILFLSIHKFNLNKKREIFTNSNSNSNSNKYTAIIVEPRKHKALDFVLENFLENLSSEWDIIICHGTLNEDYVKYIINTKLVKYKPRIKLINLNVENLSIEDYNNLLVSERFHSYIPSEIFLVFQTDTIICPEYKSYINNYLNYDYVGAPWLHVNLEIGNGGLSLRRKSKMLEIIRNCEYKNINEDVYFTKACPEIHRNMPNWQDASKFSIETVYQDESFGVHKPWLHLGDITQLKKPFCKGYDKLVELNNE
jgi:hypothetical protein